MQVGVVEEQAGAGGGRLPADRLGQVAEEVHQRQQGGAAARRRAVRAAPRAGRARPGSAAAVSRRRRGSRSGCRRQLARTSAPLGSAVLGGAESCRRGGRRAGRLPRRRRSSRSGRRRALSRRSARLAGSGTSSAQRRQAGGRGRRAPRLAVAELEQRVEVAQLARPRGPRSAPAGRLRSAAKSRGALALGRGAGTDADRQRWRPIARSRPACAVESRDRRPRTRSAGWCRPPGGAGSPKVATGGAVAVDPGGRAGGCSRSPKRSKP